MRILVVFYSWTGNTRQAAEAVARAAGADLEEIEEAAPRSGILGMLGALRDIFTKPQSAIRAPVHDPADYDLVILGTPVWGAGMTPALRAYIAERRTKLEHVAFFCTEGGSGDAGAFRQMEAACGRAPAATLTVTTKEIEAGDLAQKVRGFLASLGAVAAPRAVDPAPGRGAAARA